MNDFELQKLIEENNSFLNGRQLIITFKKGGRIAEEHVYDSSHEDIETQRALKHIFWMLCEQSEGKPIIGTSMIGRGFIGAAPWQIDGAALEKLKNASAQEKFPFSTPLRVADVVEQPNGTVLVSVESS